MRIHFNAVFHRQARRLSQLPARGHAHTDNGKIDLDLTAICQLCPSNAALTKQSLHANSLDNLDSVAGV